MPEGIREGGLAQRRVDLFFAICFAFFFASSMFSDGVYALGWVQDDSFWARSNRWYAEVTGDHLFAAHPPFLQVRTGISAFLYGPFYAVLVYAFLRRANWIRLPALLYVGAMVVGVVEHFIWEFGLGPPPDNLPLFLAFNLPYLIVPLLLGARMWRPRPFDGWP